MGKNDQHHLLVNMDKKKIVEPARLTWAGDSTITGMDVVSIDPSEVARWKKQWGSSSTNMC